MLTRLPGRLRTSLCIGLSLALVLILVWAEVAHLRSRITLSNLDYFSIADRARRLPGELDAWVSGFYPVGIPLLLRLGLGLGVDVVRGGQAISLLGGIACLFGAGSLTFSLSRSRALAVLAMAFVLCSGGFLFYSGFEGSDMLAAGLQVLSLGVLVRNPRARNVAAVAGLVNGLAYLARYTALVSALLCAGYLTLLALVQREHRSGEPVVAYVLGFVLGASPQLVTSLMVKGTPFYMTQAYHIWIKLYGGSDFITSLSSGQAEIGLWSLFKMGPQRFVANWWNEFWGFWFWMDPAVVSQPLHQVARAGWLFALLDRRLAWERRLFLLLYVVGLVGALSIFNLEYRFLLALTPVFVASALVFLWRLIPANLDLGARQLPLRAWVLLLLLGTTAGEPWTFAKTVEGGPHEHVVETSRRMHAAGAQGAGEVISTNLYHQDVASPTRDHFTMLFELDTPEPLEGPESLEGLRQGVRARGGRFLIYDDGDGAHYQPQYVSLLSPETRPAGFTPVWVPEERTFVAYRVEPETPAPQVPVGTAFAGGIELIGYDEVVSQGHPGDAGAGVGVYLYWQAAQEVTRNLKVFVHLLDEAGQLVTQHDSTPALWTYSTLDWVPGETVIDFHPLDVAGDVPPGTYTLAVGLYDGANNVRQEVLDVAGSPVDDRVILTEIELLPRP